MESRIIKLPKGGQLEVEFDPRFLDVIAKQFKLTTSELNDDHIRMFIYGSTKGALDKALEK